MLIWFVLLQFPTVFFVKCSQDFKLNSLQYVALQFYKVDLVISDYVFSLNHQLECALTRVSSTTTKNQASRRLSSSPTPSMMLPSSSSTVLDFNLNRFRVLVTISHSLFTSASPQHVSQVVRGRLKAFLTS